jgi:outer membrane receptor protein involved in Fe transport
MISKKTSKGGSKIALMTSLVLVTTPTIAEEKPEFPITLDTITVTAQKRPEDLAKVPISMNVIAAEKIEDLGMRKLEDLSLSVPNFTMSEGSSVDMIFIRGIGSERNLGYEQSVGMFVDGVYAGRGRQFSAPFLDVERVEVLKGPQGILFGKTPLQVRSVS